MPVARAYWITGVSQGEIREEILNESDDLRIRTLCTGISRGTEALIFAGRVPPDQYDAMRAPMMAGAFPFPVKYGYSAVGLTTDRRRVFVLHPHQDLFDVPAAMCIQVPDMVPDARAVLAANMETALNILWDAKPLASERIMVIGAGVVGLLVAYLCARIPATRVTVVDINPARADLAGFFGCDFALPSAAPGDQELIIHASAAEAGLRLALDRAAFEARIVEASWFGDAMSVVPLGGAFHQRRLQLISTQVGAVAPAMRGRRSYVQRLSTALSLLDDERLDALVQSHTLFENLPLHMATLLSGGLCHVITYGMPLCTV